MIKAIIFDFDGVLVSSELARFQALQRFAKKYEVIISDDTINKMVGRTTLTFLNEILNEKEKLALNNIIADHEKEYKGNITQFVAPIKHSVEFVRNYKGPLAIALASMSSHTTIEMILKHFGVYEKFLSISGKEDVMNYKPHPEIYLKAVERLGLLPNECVAVEDTVVGVRAALDAKNSLLCIT